MQWKVIVVVFVVLGCDNYHYNYCFLTIIKIIIIIIIVIIITTPQPPPPPPTTTTTTDEFRTSSRLFNSDGKKNFVYQVTTTTISPSTKTRIIINIIINIIITTKPTII